MFLVDVEGKCVYTPLLATGAERYKRVDGGFDSTCIDDLASSIVSEGIQTRVGEPPVW